MASKEQAIRDAADKLRQAIQDGRDDGLAVSWPHRWEDLDKIAVSQTGKAAVTVQVNAKDGVDAATVTKAATAAQKAADKVTAAS